MLIGLSKDNRITQWNHLAEEVSGMASDTVLGRDLWEAYPNITITPQQIQQALDDNKTLTIKYSQRGQYHFDITIYPLQEHSDTGVVILLDDVTQRVKNENLLIQRDKMSSMGEMASIMAHDINIPLRAIIKDVKEHLRMRLSAVSKQPPLLTIWCDFPVAAVRNLNSMLSVPSITALNSPMMCCR